MYIGKLSPVLPGGFLDGPLTVPLYKKYEEVRKFLDDSVSQDGGEYRQLILGNNDTLNTPFEYVELTTIERLHMSYNDWSALDIYDQARLIAYTYLRSMQEVLDAHRREQERRREQQRGKKSS